MALYFYPLRVMKVPEDKNGPGEGGAGWIVREQALRWEGGG